MDLVFFDLESPYGKGYSLKTLTYEQYIFDPKFKVFCGCLQVNNGPVEKLHGQALLDRLAELFPEGNQNVLICHNTMFDGAVLMWRLGIKAGMYLCTQAMCRALWNQQSSSLDSLARLCFPNDKTKRKGKELIQFKDIFDDLNDAQMDIMLGYCANDVSLMADCFYHMLQYFPGDELKLIDMTLKMFIDPPFMADTQRLAAYKRRLTDARRLAIINSGLPEKTLTSNDKFAAWIMSNGIPLEKIPSPTATNPDNMKWPLAKDDREFIEMRALHPEHEHVWSARIQAKSPGELRRCERVLEHAQLMDGRIAVPLNYCAAHTFRYGGTNKVNFQNFKRGSEIRYSLMAPDGYQVCVQDLSNIEARMLAWLAGETRLLDAYRRGDDVYSAFATKIFKRQINKNDDPTERFVGKTCILGLGYGTGEKKLQTTLFVAGLVFDIQECFNMKMIYRTGYPRIPLLWNKADGMIAHMANPKAKPILWGPMQVEAGRIRMPNGLYLNFPGLKMSYDEAGRPTGFIYWNGKFWTNLYGGKLVENVIQSLSRILLTSAMLKMQDELCTIGLRVALNVHDEVVTIVPTDNAEEADRRMAEILRIPPEWCNDGTLTLDTEGGYASNYSK